MRAPVISRSLRIRLNRKRRIIIPLSRDTMCVRDVINSVSTLSSLSLPTRHVLTRYRDITSSPVT
jgi:hypothetical protein